MKDYLPVERSAEGGSASLSQNRLITILAVGSRGDVQPYCALAIGLQRVGYRVRMATHYNFEELVSKLGLEFAPIAGNFQEILSSEEGQKLLEGHQTKLLSDELFQRQLADAWQACQGTDVVIFTMLATWGYHIAEKLAVPCFMAACVPLSPTSAFAFVKPHKASKNPFAGILNYASYLLVEFLFWQRYRETINRFRKETLDLPPLPFGGARFRRKPPSNLSPLPVLYGFSPSVIPKPIDWSDRLHIIGYWFLDQMKDYQPPKELIDFINDGSPPIYIGFGSMTPRNPQRLTQVVLEALNRTGQRGILLSGWAGLGKVDLPESVFLCDSVPHDWLFPRMAAVVHHGGASTTAEGLRAGVPSIVVPFFGDQPLWGQRVADLGVGPSPIPYKELSVEGLAAAIQQAVSDEAMRDRAIAIGQKIRAEDGIANAIEAFDRHLSLQK
jgi:UDP:flavonoid glycosyltransferase YjiC (YdhE family)